MSRTVGRATVVALVVALAATLLTVPSSSTTTAPASPAFAEAAAPAAALSPSHRVAVAPEYTPPSDVTDLGPVGANTSLTVDVGLASQDPGGLAAFLNASAVPGTPAYRQFLSAASADARFGALPSAVAAAEAYFAGYGLTATDHPDGLLLSVTGPGPAVGAAFGTTFDEYRNASGGTFVAHPTPASLPNVAPWTGAFGLATDTAFVPDVQVASPTPQSAPQLDCAGNAFGFTPCQIATAYDYADLDSAGTNGTGETIAVVDAYSSDETESDLLSDFQHFTSDEGLPSGGLTFLYPVPTTANLNASGTNPDWAGEEALDIEWSRAAAPGASIEMVFSPNGGAGLYYAIDWVVAHGAANVLSMSWGEPEVGIFNPLSLPACTSACNASTDGSFAILGPILELAAAEGISAFAASGDCGSADGTDGVAVNFPASEPFVTGAGATALTLAANGSYASETAWSGNASGTVGCSNQGGSGGGFSVLPRPWWQTGEGTVASKGRGVPDVAMVGSTSTPVVILVQDRFESVGGTSVATPIWAGIAATADQAAGADLGCLNPSLYAILRGADYTTAFHEVTSGSNGYRARAGWNAVTGIGTPIVDKLVGLLAQGSLAPSSLATSVYASPRFGPAPLTVRFAVGSRGGSGTLAFEGVLFGDGNASVVSAAGTNHTFQSAGVYSVQAYAVDSSGNTSASSPVVVVVGGGTDLTVGMNASTEAPSVDEDVTFTATVGGGTSPYLYNFTFGDGTSAVNVSTASVVHAYPLAGSYCAGVVVRDTLARPDGGASLRVPVDVGGAGVPSCGDPSEPLSVVANTSEPVRDAPADFPALFQVSGGTSPPAGLSNEVGLLSGDRYTSACDCTILSAAGNYTVQEWVNDTVDGAAAAEANVSVAPALNATFTASTLSGTVPLTVDFSATAHGGHLANAGATRWTFGNGLNATGSSAQTTYTAPGEYVVIASLSDRGFGNASRAFVLDAEAAGSTAVGVTATVAPAVNVSSGTTVVWNATPVGPPAAVAGASVAWGLGNGRSAFGREVNETYYASVDLLAGDILAASVSVETPRLSVPVVVPITLAEFFATEADGFVPATNALVLDEDVSPTDGLVPLMVNGTARASGPDGVGIDWTFGDGQSATGATVSHVYYGAHDYTVVVQATDPFGDLAERADAVVATLPLAVAACGTRTGIAPYTVTLSAQATGGNGPPYSYLWTLAGGGQATSENLTVSFARAGTYSLGVVVTDPAGETASCAWTIVVGTPPPVTSPEVVLVGVGAGVALAAFFLWVTRPPPQR